MIKKEMIYRNPLVNLGYDNEDILPVGGFGAVLAHAGVGKTALLVQLALNMMLRENSVLHVSLNDAVSKVDLWYQELFHDIAEKFGIPEINDYWDKIQPYRFIMTFKVEGFSAPKLEERLTDLMEQNIFKPHTVIIDGFKFDDAGRGQLMQLKELAKKYSMCLVVYRSYPSPRAAAGKRPASFISACGGFVRCHCSTGDKRRGCLYQITQRRIC